MSTLHTLRRGASLSLSDLAQRTGINVRRLAEYEYAGVQISDEDRGRIARCFGVEAWVIAGGWQAAAAPRTGLAPQQAQFGAALAAGGALLWGLGLGAHQFSRSLAALQPLSSRPTRPVALVATAAPVPTATIADTATPIPTASPIPSSAQIAQHSTTMEPTASPVPTAGVMVIDPRPHLCPLISGKGVVVVTQGYGVGTHTPASINGAVDLAIDSNSDGHDDIAATLGAVVVASHAGTVRVTLNSWPAGNHVWVTGVDGWHTGYSHLSQVFVHSEQEVQAGQPLGIVGMTGEASGPHLDFQVWHGTSNLDPSEWVLCAAYNHAPLRRTSADVGPLAPTPLPVKATEP